MDIKKTVVIFGASAMLLAGAMTLSMQLTKRDAVDLAVPEDVDTLTATLGAREEIPLYYDDDDLLLLPLRSVIEGLGGSVYWEEESKSIVVGYQGKILRLQSSSQVAWFDGLEILLPVAPETINGCVYIEGDILEECFTTEVIWSSESRQITVKNMENGTPSVVSIMYEMGNFSIEMPRISGLNDTSYERSLQDSIAEAVYARLQNHFTEEVAEPIAIELEKGYIGKEFISFAWTDESGEFFYSMNIDLREQRNVTLADMLSDETYANLEKRFENFDFTRFYISKAKELVLAQADGEELIVEEVDPSAVQEETAFIWKGKYTALFFGGKVKA